MMVTNEYISNCIPLASMLPLFSSIPLAPKLNCAFPFGGMTAVFFGNLRRGTVQVTVTSEELREVTNT